MPQFISEGDIQENNISTIAKALSPQNFPNSAVKNKNNPANKKKRVFKFLNHLSFKKSLTPDQELDHIETIARRIDFLAAKIANSPADKFLFLERKEIKALAWAINTLTMNYTSNNYVKKE